MANKYAGTQTEKNLEAAFAGESMARNKYTYYASKAKKEGMPPCSSLNHSLACSFSLSAVFRNSAAICS